MLAPITATDEMPPRVASSVWQIQMTGALAALLNAAGTSSRIDRHTTARDGRVALRDQRDRAADPSVGDRRDDHRSEKKSKQRAGRTEGQRADDRERGGKRRADDAANREESKSTQTGEQRPTGAEPDSGNVSVLATPNTTSASLDCAIKCAYRGLKATRMAVARRPTKKPSATIAESHLGASDRDIRAAAAARVPTSAGAYPATVAAVFPMV